MVTDEKTLVDPDTEEAVPKVSPWGILKMNGPEWPLMVVGTLASAAMGSLMPVFAFLFGEMLGTLSQPADKARQDSVTYAIVFVVVGVFAGIAMFLQSLMFSMSGESLYNRLVSFRGNIFQNTVKPWYKLNGAVCGPT